MRTLGSMLAETYASWLRSVSTCCGFDEKPHQDSEKPVLILRDQPVFISPPSAEPIWYGEQNYERERGRSFGQRSASRSSNRSKRRWLSRSTSRRPQISNPSNFRHLQSDSFQSYQGEGQPRQRPVSFRPLQLSIYQPDNRLSSLLPYFDPNAGREMVTPPPPAHTAGSSRQWDDSSATLTNDRSYSSMSFHIPRKHVREGSNFSQGSPITPPTIPPKSRARAYTTPNPEPLVERIASAMLEKERLQAEIDSVIERQSLYISSRPSTAYGLADLEPMPSIPAIPAAAPSFAERASLDDRPRTAPSQSTSQMMQEKTLALQVAAFNSHPPQLSYSRVRIEGSPTKEFRDDASFDRPLAPPLPLVLRPPLRKKKSFSRVSNWLFPAEADDVFQSQRQRRDINLADPVTNLPKPMKNGEGYYQCVAPPNRVDGGVFRSDTVSSLTTSESLSAWETDEDDEEEDEEERGTMPTTCQSPGSSPVIQNTPKHTPTIQRTATFGKGGSSVGDGVGVKPVEGLLGVAIGNGPRPQSVGVAF
ncbi:hypothetical protein B0H66DRAFT_559164 [Apodospora peruviana]|uniref:Uncharacterized protein n=1 Tax=Apodospora peruviana TaxID=516989 RepID=A0AAE0I7X1_9PEZI|nr:hypothetical protein B0H66DRAFT_559164 [Apodospora peruviana]